MKRPGPNLKKPELKVPPVLIDLYRDLRDRRLLPLVAVAALGILAVPLLLKDSPPAPPPVAFVEPPPAEEAGAARLSVVKAAPGIREPSKRLSHLSPEDPFEQKYTNAAVTPDPTGVTTTTESTATTATEAGTEGATSSPPSSSDPPAESGGSSPGGGKGAKGVPAGEDGLVFYTFAVDVQVARTETAKDGRKETSDPVVHKGVLPTTSLPGDKAEVVTYMGISPKTRKPLFLVSSEVTAVFGDAGCVAGSESCQLLELEQGMPETFVYGENDVRYKINVLKIEPVVTGHS
jgi:hypothetical protein